MTDGLEPACIRENTNIKRLYKEKLPKFVHYRSEFVSGGASHIKKKKDVRAGECKSIMETVYLILNENLRGEYFLKLM